MAGLSSNLFLRMHKWAARQDENFLTESLAVVLEHLLVLAPAVGTRLVGSLTGGFIDLPTESSSAIVIRTQVETGQGRPDLEISVPHRLVWIEVKAESGLRTGQLEGYRVLLDKSGSIRHGLFCSLATPKLSPQRRPILISRSAGSKLQIGSRVNCPRWKKPGKSPVFWRGNSSISWEHEI
jgi:hypothetical protein